MCRHVLPRFNLPVGHILHNVGWGIAFHPVAVSTAILVPLCTAIALLVFHRLKRPASACRSGPWVVFAGRQRSLFGARCGPAHPI